MQLMLTTALALHVLASMFWAGSTFTLARTGGVKAETLFTPQMGAFADVPMTAMYLWHTPHERGFGLSEWLLAIGAI